MHFMPIKLLGFHNQELLNTFLHCVFTSYGQNCQIFHR